jgi:hypothetical protein
VEWVFESSNPAAASRHLRSIGTAQEILKSGRSFRQPAVRANDHKAVIPAEFTKIYNAFRRKPPTTLTFC